MIIEQINQNKIKVVVDTDEQRKYGITYETMTYCDCNTRKLCESIVERAKNEVGFSVGNSKLLVEAKQGLNGSVTLFLSKISVQPDEIEELFGQSVLFSSIDDLLDSFFVFNLIQDKLKTRNVYVYENKYYMYFELLATHETAKKFLTELLEFCEKTSFSYEFLEEHGEKLYS